MRKLDLLMLLWSMCGIVHAQHVNSEAAFPQGAINGLFSVSDGVQVYFSQGNLQYIGSASIPYWKFADYQWDYLGITTNQNSNKTNVDRDLFGWGTSNDNHGAKCYHPWSISNKNEDYYAYGQPNYNLDVQTGYANWGTNPIRNGGNIANAWRTLNHEEWEYVFDKRTTSSGIRYAKAQVNGVNGVILLPDDWKTTYYKLQDTNQSKTSFNSNIINASLWNTLEQYGAVFLPAAGCRHQTKVVNVGKHGDYWSSSCYNVNKASYVYFSDDCLHDNHSINRSFGHSVRLVHAADNYFVINTISNPVVGGTVSRQGTFDQGTRCTLKATPNEEYSFLHWTENGEVISTEAIYSFVISRERTLIAHFIPTGVNIKYGALNGVFSVSADCQVNFSQGNLQYIGSAKMHHWKFAEHQWDCIGNKAQSDHSPNGHYDLFGWGTSGYHDSKDPNNIYYQPWSSAISLVNNATNYFGYGPSINMKSPDLTGDSKNYDWGVNNHIYNGGEQPGIWRTLTRDEWEYVLNNRNTTSGIRFVKAIVNDVNGLILFPDDWDGINFSLNGVNNSDDSFTCNVISLSQWNVMEQQGAVFLPAAGFRYDASIRDVGSLGCYWSASHSSEGDAWYINFNYRDLGIDAGERYYGHSVRLVRIVQ